MTSMKTNINHRKGRISRLLSVISVLALICMIVAVFDSGPTLNLSQRLSIVSNRKLLSPLSTEDAAFNDPLEVSNSDGVHTRSTLRTQVSSRSKQSGQDPGRKLQGEYPNFDFNDPAMASAIVVVLLLLFLLCCCRGMLCDILACVCLYEMCCDDGVVGGFDLMPF